MSERAGEGREKSNQTSRKRPVKELHIKPITIDGTVYDPYNHPKQVRNADGEVVSYIGGRPLETDDAEPIEDLDKDEKYAKRFWDRGQPEGLREAMIDNIHRAAGKENGFIGSFVNPEGIDEEDKEKLSAYRVLAKELGYEVGKYKFSPKAHTARARISKPQEK